MNPELAQDAYVRHESGYWKVREVTDPVKVWREMEQGGIESARLPSDSLRVVPMEKSPWNDPHDL